MSDLRVFGGRLESVMVVVAVVVVDEESVSETCSCEDGGGSGMTGSRFEEEKVGPIRSGRRARGRVRMGWVSELLG
jgi:hypothetical protein